MAIKTRTIEYHHDDTLLEGLMAWDDAAGAPRPGVLVAPVWAGRNAQADHKAEALAALGYVGFALDMYGKGVLGSSIDENARLMQPFVDDRTLLQGRMQRALDVMRAEDEVDDARTAAIGFCFGGMCVLDLARSGAEIGGVVSFHGLLKAPQNAPGTAIKAKVLALHGHDDPLAPPQDVLALQQELTAAGADWQVHVYGHAMHAFTNPAANDRDFGTVYQPDADRRSWRSMEDFLTEVLGAEVPGPA